MQLYMIAKLKFNINQTGYSSYAANYLATHFPNNTCMQLNDAVCFTL